MRLNMGSIVLLLILVVAAPVFAQSNTASISGRVIDTAGKPVTDATVTLVETNASARVASDGSFRFDHLTPGHYHVLADSRRAGNAIGEIGLTEGSAGTVEIIVDPAIHSEEIVVSASVETRRASEVYQPVAVLGEEELARRVQPTVGETLSQERGVTSTYFGPGSSRPVIRGFGADRIRILEEGVGTSDVSNVSPDHAVSVDAATAEQIEIVRGPATLLYGSNAVGGVVNILDRRVPATVPAEALRGEVVLRGGTVSNEHGGTLSLDGGFRELAWHVDFSKRETGDYEIPGPAEHDHDGDEEEEEASGILENSSLDNMSFNIGGSIVGKRGYLGVALNQFQTNYGIPGHAAHGEAAGEEGVVRIDLEKQRVDVKGELRDIGMLRSVRVRVGASDYEHVELEGDEVGTRFLSDGFEGRIDASHRAIGGLTGSFGVQLTSIDFAAIGEEAFVPPTTTDNAAVFLFEELTRGPWNLQFGTRYEMQDVAADVFELPARSFSGVSGSVGVIFRPNASYAFSASLARAVRLPTSQELYANGPHIATGQFEIGDINLREETSVGLDLAVRKTAGRVRGELSLFNNQFDGYIFEMPTGEEEDDLPVFRYSQSDARFRGIELDTHTELMHFGENHLELELGGDFVRATIDDGGNVPRIPPFRVSAGLRFRGVEWNGGAEVCRYADQNRIAGFEEATAGYTMVNADLGYRLVIAETIHEFLLRGTNLTDELARSHVSPLKERAPLPGRDVSLSYRLLF